MNLPNWITVARIALVPVFLLVAWGESTLAAVSTLAVFVVASLSDSLDGYLARKNDQITRTGQFLDPTADKLLVGAALVVLVVTRDFPLWTALVIAFREIAVQILRTQIARGGGDLPASAAGKLKTVMQICMVSWWLLPWDDINVGHWAWLGLSLFTTVWSGAEYFSVARKPEKVSA